MPVGRRPVDPSCPGRLMVNADTFTAGLDSLNRRLITVGFLPLAAAFTFVFVLLCAGAPDTVDLGRAWHTIVNAPGRAMAATIGALIAFTVVLHPLQTRLVRILEGYLPSWMRPAAMAGRALQRRLRHRMRKRAAVPTDLGLADADDLVQAAGQWGERLRERFPSRSTVMPTGLGNVLAAAEERAGAAYGWDTVVFWPRLYPLLPATTRAVVDDRRNRLDSMASFTVAFAVAALAVACLTATTGWWLLLSMIPSTLAALAYRGAVDAGIAYGQALTVAIDLHRFSLYESLHLALPATSDAEAALADTLALQWRQGDRPAWAFRHDRTPARERTHRAEGEGQGFMNADYRAVAPPSQ